MDIIKRAILFGGKAIVSVMDTTELVQEAINLHSFSDSVAQAMGKLLTMTAFMSGNFKSQGNKLTLIIKGDGEAGKMVASGDYGAKVRAYCENPSASIIQKKSINDMVGRNGNLIVIKDFGLKEPYNGYSQIVNGSIDADFAYYFTTSEQLPSAVALGCEVDSGKCHRSCGVIVQPMPNCEEEILVILQDIVSNFTNLVELLKDKTLEELIDFYFGHFEINILDDIYPKYICSCSDAKVESMILSLGYEQAMDIVNSQGHIEVCCEFCNTKRKYDADAIEKLFNQLS